jgi:hypothetical protein
MKNLITICAIIFFSGTSISAMNSTENRQEMSDRDIYEHIKSTMTQLKEDALTRHDVYALMAITSFRVEANADEWDFIHRGRRVTYHLSRTGLSDDRGTINPEYLRVWREFNKEESAK